MYGTKWNTCRLLVEKTEGKKPQGTPRCRWVNYVKMDVGETGWDAVGWIGQADDRYRWRALVNTVMNLWVP
jgi:hypothetical protein